MTDLLSTPTVPGDELRPDWSWLAGAAPLADLALARQRAQNLLADHGVTYGDNDGRWRLDPEPVILHSTEWGGLERGLVQRAELLDAVLHDLYGPRRLLSDSLLPPSSVLGHAGFLRAVDGLSLPGGRELVLSATDLVRGRSGAWLAVADRAQAPSGAGYAMEDRRVVAQVLAGVYRRASIARLGPFFHAMRLALHAVAPAGAAEPRAVLLTSGGASETAFDQAYLAAMLGLPLVEGTDLMVRDGRVWLRGLHGPEPVDVVLRRIDGDWADPVELHQSSRLGVPGLVRAIRAGTVSVVNPLGSSVLESPGVTAHLPRLARTVLGADLDLAGPEMWWCGDPRNLSHVLTNLDRLVLVPSAGVRMIAGWNLTVDQRAELSAKIIAEPWAWAGQEPVGPVDPFAPTDGPRAGVLRTFAVTHGGSYQVMAGGLARVSTKYVVSSAHGAYAKDVWVLGPAVAVPMASEADDVVLAGRTGGISPRTAQNLYWIGRYAERAESAVRMLRAVVDRWDDFHISPQGPGGAALDVLLHALVSPDPDETDLAVSPTLRDLVLDKAVPRSVAWSVNHLVTAAQEVRDQLSTDTFGPLARIERALRVERGRPVPPTTLAEAAELAPVPALVREGAQASSGLRPVLDRVLESLLALAGIATEGLTRDVGWRFLDAGRRIERAQQMVDTLSTTTLRAGSVEVETLVLESVLLVHESAITYRRRYQREPTLAAVLDVLVHDRTNPRSLGYSLDRLLDDLREVPVPWRTPEQRDQLLADVADLEAELQARSPSSGKRERLLETLESMRWRLRAANDEIERVHFVRPAPLRTLTDVWGGAPATVGGAAE